MRKISSGTRQRRVLYSTAIALTLIVAMPRAVYAVTWATEWTQILNNLELVLMQVNQIKQLYNEAVMIKNQVESLKSISSYKGSWQNVDQILAQIEGLKNKSDSIWNEANSVYKRAKDLYPKIEKDGGYLEGVKVLNDPVLAAADGSVLSAAERLERQKKEAAAVKELLQKSDEAVGQTQTLQVMNKLMAQLIEQMQSIREQNDWIRLQMSAESEKRAKAENKLSDNLNSVFQEYKSAPSTFKLDKEF